MNIVRNSTAKKSPVIKMLLKGKSNGKKASAGIVKFHLIEDVQNSDKKYWRMCLINALCFAANHDQFIVRAADLIWIHWATVPFSFQAADFCILIQKKNPGGMHVNITLSVSLKLILLCTGGKWWFTGGIYSVWEDQNQHLRQRSKDLLLLKFSLLENTINIYDTRFFTQFFYILFSGPNSTICFKQWISLECAHQCQHSSV